MNNTWIPLQAIPHEGKTLVMDNQSLWQEPLREFGISCRIIDALRAEVFVLPQEQGVLFRGKISGKIALPCDRCADDSIVPVASTFDCFEPYPAANLAGPSADGGQKHGGKASPVRKGKDENDDADHLDDPVDEAVIRVAQSGRGVEINPSALVWEEFSLALPVKPLCSDSCKGLCPHCGANRNTQECACANNSGDPRLAVLRGLTLTKK